ncbi:SGNH/GDSL hydrolase family protein [Gordonia sp. NPDC003424]
MTHNTFPDIDRRSEVDDPLVLAPEDARLRLAGAPWQRFAVIGDSIAEGIGDRSPGYADLPWADRVATMLRSVRPNLAYLNTGRTGATTSQVHTEQLSTLADFEPDLVHISCGGNDVFLGADMDTVEHDLDALCTAVVATGATVSMFTLADAFTGKFASFRPRFDEFAGIVRRVAHHHDAVLTEFWDHPARLRRNWLSDDRIHLSRAGHAVVASEVARSLAARGAGRGH